MNIKKYLVFDIGGTFVKYAIIDNTFKIHEKNKFSNQLEIDINLLKDEISKIYKKYQEQINGVAISSFGVINKQHNTIFWSGMKKYNYRNFDFKNIFNKHPFYVENDVNCALIGEKYFGSLKNISNAIMITLGTGIGGAILINNQLYCGDNLFAGEVGSMFINAKTWEEQASVKALINNSSYYPTINNVRDLFDQAKIDMQLTNYFNDWYEKIAIGIVNLCYMYNPNKVIIGGGISNCSDFSVNKIYHYCKKYLLSNYYLITPYTIQKAQLGNDAALYGALFLFLNRI